MRFESKLLSIGVIAVGSETSFTAKIRNAGLSPAVFYINQNDDAPYQVTPEQVRQSYEVADRCQIVRPM